MTDIFDSLTATAANDGVHVMLEELAQSLRERHRWHALFDLRLMQARIKLGLPPTGDIGTPNAATQEQLDQASLTACSEVGWPLLEAGEVTAAWMYLRATSAQNEVAKKLAELAASPPEDEETAMAQMQEIIQVALWENVDPALGIRLVIESQGTCNSITAFDQVITRLPGFQQQSAIAVLVRHLNEELCEAIKNDLAQRDRTDKKKLSEALSITELLESAGGLHDDPSFHVDVSHLQSVLRFARISTDMEIIQLAWELAVYASRLPENVTYPGEPPFEKVGEASCLFFGALLGKNVDEALAFFRKAITPERIAAGETLPSDTLLFLLSRLGRSADAVHVALERPPQSNMPSMFQAAGMLPSLVELAIKGNKLDDVRHACRERGDEITFAATWLNT